MAISKQDLKNKTLRSMQKEQEELEKQEKKKTQNSLAQAAKIEEAAKKKEQNDLIGAKDSYKLNHAETMKEYDFTPAAQKRAQQISESVAEKTTPTKVSAKAISSEAEKYVPAAQKRKQATSDQIYENVLKGEAYLQSEGDGLAKGLINRFRSVPGETVENAAYFIKDRLNPQNGFEEWLVNNADRVVQNNVAGQIGNIADEQLWRAKETTGDVGDFLIDAADAATRMGSNAVFFGPGNIALSQGIGGGLEEYRTQREAGANKGEALFRGATSGAAGYVIERFGGIGAAKNNILKAIVPGTNKLSTQAATSLIGNIAKNAFDEGGEELAESTVNALSDIIADMVFNGEVTIDFDLVETLRGAGIGALIGGGFGAVNYSPAAEPSVSPVEVPIAETENVTPEVANEQEGAFANAREEATRPLTEQEVQEIKKGASIVTDTDGDTYIDIKSDVLKNVAPQNWVAKVKNVIRSVFPKGFYVNGEHIEVTGKSRGEFTNSNESRNLSFFEPEVYADKMRTSPYLDVISQNAEYTTEELEHARKDNITSFERGTVKLKIGNNNYFADVDIGVKSNGKKMFYDLSNIKKIEAASSEPEQNSRTSEQLEVTSNNNIPQDNDVVNNENVSAQKNIGAQNGAQSGAHPNTVGAKQSSTPFYTAGVQYGTYDPKTRQTYAGNETFEAPVRLDNSGEKEVSEAVETIAASPLGTQETVDYMIQNIDKFTHSIDTDVDSVTNAKVYLEENGLEKSLGQWKSIVNGKRKYTKDAGVLAATTIRLLQQQGRVNEANEMVAELVAEISTAAQATQGAETIYKILDPAQMKIATNTEYYVNNLVKKLNENHKNKLKDNQITVDQKLLKQALDSNGTDKQGEAWDKVYADIANQVPANFWEKINNIRYFCMLSNPKTHIRNVVSNAVMGGINAIKDRVKVAVEAAYNNSKGVKEGKLQEIKTVTAKRVPKEYKDFAKNDFDVIKESFNDAGKYSETSDTFVQKHRTKINDNILLGAIKARFKGDSKTEQLLNKLLDQGVFNSVAELNSFLLNEVEDGGAKSSIYAHAMSQYMAANKLTPEYLSSAEGEAELQKARAHASAEALYNTFNEKNFISSWLSSGSKGSKIVDIATGATIPFRKVPINLVKTGFEYSPFGLLKAGFKMAEAVKTQSDPSKAINDIAKGLTGSGLVAVGALLRSLGYLTNGLPEDDKEANFEKMLGSQAFAFKVGNKSYSLDWLQPVGMMLFSGAAAYDAGRDLFKRENNILVEDDVLKTLGNVSEIGINSILSFYEPMMEMSMLSNVKELVAPEYTRDWNKFLGDVIGDYVNQFVPNILASLAKTIDETERNAYYVDKTDAVSDAAQIAVQNVMSKIPGLSQKLPEKVDVWGNTQKRNSNVAVRAFENFVSPGTYKEYKTTKVDEMLQQLYAKTGEASVLPTSFAKNFTVDGENTNLSAQDYVDAQKKKGQTAYNMLNQLVANKDFQKLSPEQKTNIVSDVYSYANVKGKQEVSNYTTDTKWYSNIEKAEKEGLSKSNFLVQKNIYGNIEKTEERSKDMQMYDQLIADKTTTTKEDYTILKYVAGVDFSKYEKGSNNPDAILSAYNIIKTEEQKGGDGTQQRIIKQLIANKTTSAKEDLAILENVRNVNFENYKKAASGNADKTLYLYNQLNTKNATGSEKEKDADIKAIQKKFKEDIYDAREIYHKAKGDWNESVKDVVENGENREKKIDVLERFKFSDKEITQGYNAVIGLNKKEDMIDALTNAFGSKNKATTFYNILKGKKGYK